MYLHILSPFVAVVGIIISGWKNSGEAQHMINVIGEVWNERCTSRKSWQSFQFGCSYWKIRIICAISVEEGRVEFAWKCYVSNVDINTWAELSWYPSQSKQKNEAWERSVLSGNTHLKPGQWTEEFGFCFYSEVIKVIWIIPLDLNTHSSVDTLKKAGMNLSAQTSKAFPLYV